VTERGEARLIESSVVSERILWCGFDTDLKFLEKQGCLTIRVKKEEERKGKERRRKGKKKCCPATNRFDECIVLITTQSFLIRVMYKTASQNRSLS